MEVDNDSGNDFNRKLKGDEVQTKVGSIWVERNTSVSLYEKEVYRGET